MRTHFVLVSCSSSKACPDYVLISSDKHFSTLHSWTASDKHTVVNLDHSGWVQKIAVNLEPCPGYSSQLLSAACRAQFQANDVRFLTFQNSYSLTSHSCSPLTHLLTLHTGHRYQWGMLKFQLFFHFYSGISYLFILLYLLSLSSDAHCNLALTPRLTSSEAPFFALRSVCPGGCLQ